MHYQYLHGLCLLTIIIKVWRQIYYQKTYNTTTQFYFCTKLGGNAAPRSRIGCNGPASGWGEGNRCSIRSNRSAARGCDPGCPRRSIERAAWVGLSRTARGGALILTPRTRHQPATFALHNNVTTPSVHATSSHPPTRTTHLSC